MEILILLSTGFGVGILSSFFGVGGGIIIVPTLYILYPQMTSYEIIAVSLLTIFLNTAINNYFFFKQKKSPSLKIILAFATFGAIGAFCGTYLIKYIDSATLKKMFAVILILIVLKLIFYRGKTKNLDENYIENFSKLSLTSLLGSCLAALTGLGGGVIFVPLLNDFVKVPFKRIPAFSNMAMMISVGFALIPHIEAGYINYKAAFIIFGGALCSIKLGMSLNDKVSVQNKKILFGLILLASSLKILLT